MEKMLDENDLNKSKEIFEKYQDFFNKCGIYSLDDIKIQKLPDYLADRYPKKYGVQNFGDYQNYHTDKNLNEVFAFVGKEEAYFFGTDDAVIKGHIANENLKDGKITLSEELSKVTSQVIFANNPEKAKEFEENFFHEEGKDLECLEQILEKQGNFQNRINEQAQKIDPNMPEIEVDSENRIMEKGQAQTTIQKEDEPKDKVIVGEEGKKQPVPDDVQKACKRMGVNHIRGFFYVNAAELSNKADATRVNKEAGKVLIIEVYDNNLQCNKYYGFQGEKMVLYGNDSEMNKAVKDVTGNVTQMGNLVGPLKPQEAQYFEYEDNEGLVIREEIDDNSELSMQDINRYREEMEDTLEKYSQQIYAVKNDKLLSAEEKIARMQAIDDWCDEKTTEITKENDVLSSTDKDIDKLTDEQTLEMQEEVKEDDEPDAWEVPGRREH